MTAVWILIGFLGLLCLIGLIRGSVTIICNDDCPFRMSIRVAGLCVFSIPHREKKVSPKDYSPRALAKKRKKEEKKKQKALAKSHKKNKAQKAGSDSRKKSFLKGKDIGELIGFVKDSLGTLLSGLSRHLRIKLVRVRIAVATKDAAQTAILYGAVSPSIAYLLEFLEQNAHVGYPYTPDVEVSADFVGETTHVDLKLILSIRVWQILSILIKWLILLIQGRKTSQSSDSSKTLQERNENHGK